MEEIFTTSFYFLQFLVKKHGLVFALLSKKDLDKRKEFIKEKLQSEKKSSSKVDKFFRDMHAAHFRYLYANEKFELSVNDTEIVYPIAHWYLLVSMEDIRHKIRFSLPDELKEFFRLPSIAEFTSVKMENYFLHMKGNLNAIEDFAN